MQNKPNRLVVKTHAKRVVLKVAKVPIKGCVQHVHTNVRARAKERVRQDAMRIVQEHVGLPVMGHVKGHVLRNAPVQVGTKLIL